MQKNLLLDCISKRKSFEKDDYEGPKKGMSIDKIPTLKNGFFRKASPMLKVRYETIDRWENSTHGHWLSTADMEALWHPENIQDNILEGIFEEHVAAQENWPNIASSLFLPERLSLFAGSDLGNEKIYLLWLDFEDEPEIWVYDSNGESRYKNLQDYLLAYMNDDISAASVSWRA